MTYYKSGYLLDYQDDCEVIRLMFALVGHQYPEQKINEWLELNQRNYLYVFCYALICFQKNDLYNFI